MIHPLNLLFFICPIFDFVLLIFNPYDFQPLCYVCGVRFISHIEDASVSLKRFTFVNWLSNILFRLIGNNNYYPWSTSWLLAFSPVLSFFSVTMKQIYWFASDCKLFPNLYSFYHKATNSKLAFSMPSWLAFFYCLLNLSCTKFLSLCIFLSLVTHIGLQSPNTFNMIFHPCFVPAHMHCCLV